MSPHIRVVHSVGIALLCGAVGVATPVSTIAQGIPASASQQSAASLSSARLADQLGVKASPGQSADLAVYGSLNGTLVDPAKLAKLGLTGLHEGARVTALRVSNDRLRLEVDEIDPAPLTKKATLKIDDKGELSVVAGR